MPDYRMLDFSGPIRQAEANPMGRGLADLGDMLDAFYARRQQKQQVDAQNALARARLEQDATFKRADDVRNDRQLEIQQQQQQAAAQREKERQDLERQKFRAQGMDKIQPMLEHGDIEGAAPVAANYGLNVSRAEAPKVQPTSADDMFDASYGALGASSLGLLPQLPTGQQRADTQNQNMAEAYKRRGIADISIPGGADFLYMPGSGMRARQRQGEEAAGNFNMKGSTDEENAAIAFTKDLMARGLVTQDKAGEFLRNEMQFRTSQANQEKRARIAAGAAERKAGTVTPAQAATGNREDLKMLGADVDRWQKDSGYDQVRLDITKLKEAQKLLSSKNSLSQTQARYALGKTIAGPGSFTEGEQRNIIGSVAGKYGSWESTVAKFLDGTMGAADARAFVGSVKEQLEYKLGPVVDNLEEGFRSKFTTEGTPYANMQGNVANQYNALFGAFGRHMKPTGDSKAVGGAPPTALPPKALPSDLLRHLGELPE